MLWLVMFPLTVSLFLSQIEEIKENFSVHPSLPNAFIYLLTYRVGGRELWGVGVYFPPTSHVGERLHCRLIR